MPSLRWNDDRVERRDGGYHVADQAMAVAAADQHEVDVVVSFERRMAAGRDLEITQNGEEIGRTFGEDLPRYLLEMRSGLFLVGEPPHTLPFVNPGMANNPRHDASSFDTRAT